VSNAQSWTLLGLVGVLLSVIGSLDRDVQALMRDRFGHD
jgi:hypothetical protein